jgi:hypothetical protein
MKKEFQSNYLYYVHIYKHMHECINSFILFYYYNFLTDSYDKHILLKHVFLVYVTIVNMFFHSFLETMCSPWTYVPLYLSYRKKKEKNTSHQLYVLIKNLMSLVCFFLTRGWICFTMPILYVYLQEHYEALL